MAVDAMMILKVRGPNSKWAFRTEPTKGAKTVLPRLEMAQPFGGQ